MEAWTEEGVAALTYFFAREGLVCLDNAGAVELLEREKLLRCEKDPRRSAYVAPIVGQPHEVHCQRRQ